MWDNRIVYRKSHRLDGLGRNLRLLQLPVELRNPKEWAAGDRATDGWPRPVELAVNLLCCRLT